MPVGSVRFWVALASIVAVTIVAVRAIEHAQQFRAAKAAQASAQAALCQRYYTARRARAQQNASPGFHVSTVSALDLINPGGC